jgi:mono/diheme cytochrome c family protein
MKRWARPLLCIGVAVAFHGCGMDRTFTPTPGTPPSAPPDAASIARGAYLVDAANCAGCHTDKKHGGAPFAGGGAVPTPFGDYYSRNITPDREHGIGAWSDANFLEALREGISPSGAPYFSAFPFTSFTNMTDRDILDIKAYLGTLPPSAQENRAHDVGFPYDMRAGAGFWRALYFSPGPLKPDPAHDAAWNRGNYLVNAVAHCAECHTPRDWLGGLENEKRFSGGRLAGPDV